MNLHKERLAQLRREMAGMGIDAWLITGSDPHRSEYLPERWKTREWLTGFTGSYGHVVVTQDDAVLWTDARYHLQAERELEGSGFRLEPLRESKDVAYPRYLSTHLSLGACLGLDAACTTWAEYTDLQAALPDLRMELSADPLDLLWTDRPALPEDPVFLLDEKYTGRSFVQKQQDIWAQCGHREAWLFSKLDQIAWLLNIRSSDIAFNPVAISYLFCSPEETRLFVRLEKLSPEVQLCLQDQGILCADYEECLPFLAGLSHGTRLYADPAETPCRFWSVLLQSGMDVRPSLSPVKALMCIKNETETEGFRASMKRDGVALTRYFIWIEQEMAARRSHPEISPLTEMDCVRKLSALRAAGARSMGDSFYTIAAYGANAASPHYEPTPQRYGVLEPHGLFLTDSGGQYLDGTTDVTRTIPLGPVTEEESRDYTLVLAGMIRLAMARFPQGTRATNLDVLAREALWAFGKDYAHGTGHGVGHFNGVHESPPDFRQAWREAPLQAGMITSDEPGMYVPGSHGVRHENLLLCKAVEQNAYGSWLAFETLTLCYIDTSIIVPSLLDGREKQWLNTYNRTVYQTLAPLLAPGEVQWLFHKCKPISLA